MLLFKQTVFSNKEKGTYGNCTQACLATILQLPMEEVPHFLALAEGNSERYWELIIEFLAKHNIGYVYNSKLPSVLGDIDTYHLIGGPSPRGNGLLHHIVGKNGEPFFDPHPDNTFLAGTPDEWVTDYLVYRNSNV